VTYMVTSAVSSPTEEGRLPVRPSLKKSAEVQVAGDATHVWYAAWPSSHALFCATAVHSSEHSSNAHCTHRRILNLAPKRATASRGNVDVNRLWMQP
jgi:hypothetical protein